MAAKLVVTQETPPGEPKPRLCLRRYSTTLRRGMIRADNREIAFGLVSAVSGKNYYLALFDLNGDGQLERGGWSPEVYRVPDKYVRLGETDYEFVIDRYGRNLQLKPLTERLPPTMMLRAGYPAPDFSFTDLEGKARKLSDYRGKVVLLDFWVINCGPCQEDAPELVKAYEKLRSKGFEMIGINGEDSGEVLRKFMAEKRIAWPQTIQEKWEGPIHKLYRFESWPTYYLIGKDGAIIAKRNSGGVTLADLEKLLGLAEK
jgi:peroxiredoxin